MSGAVPLPIKLESFTGRNTGSTNQLNWKTAEEHNFSHFELQRSADGLTFDKLAAITGLGNALGGKYSYTDERPFEGKNLYRLRMVDKDGKGTLSDVVTLSVKSGTGLSVNVYPNPVKQQLHVTVTGKQGNGSRLLVMDIVGKTVYTATLSSNTADVDMSALPSGIYIIKYMDDTHTSITKVTKD